MRPPREQRLWGALGAAAAGLFAIWMLFLPGSGPDVVRLGRPAAGRPDLHRGRVHLPDRVLPQRAVEPNWLRLRWMVWGNLAFTGTLLVATYWHLEQFKWDTVHVTPFGHIWLVLYILEPVAMIFLLPPGILGQRI